MESYQNLFENRLVEMPYVDMGGGEAFDLQLEEFKDFSEVLKFLTDIIEGSKYTDKHKSIIQLKNSTEKKEFLKSLKNDMIFNNIIKNHFSENEKKLLDLLYKSI
jgi:hypothetical protein